MELLRLNFFCHIQSSMEFPNFFALTWMKGVIFTLAEHWVNWVNIVQFEFWKFSNTTEECLALRLQFGQCSLHVSHSFTISWDFLSTAKFSSCFLLLCLSIFSSVNNAFFCTSFITHCMSKKLLIGRIQGKLSETARIINTTHSEAVPTIWRDSTQHTIVGLRDTNVKS